MRTIDMQIQIIYAGVIPSSSTHKGGCVLSGLFRVGNTEVGVWQMVLRNLFRITSLPSVSSHCCVIIARAGGPWLQLLDCTQTGISHTYIQ